MELDRKAGIRIIRRLYQDGLLKDDAFHAACDMLRPRSAKVAWARRMLLFFGSALVLAGVIFFFAYNWSRMGRILKFAAVEAGIVACVVMVHVRGATRLSGKVLLLAASILVGVLLAIYGQTYQTGADAFELFVGWAVLISGWVLISRFAGLWLVWLILLNTGVVLYWLQIGHLTHSFPYEFLCLAAAILNGLALAASEVGIRRGLDWLSGRWLRGILITAVLVTLSVPMIGMILDPGNTKRVTVVASCLWGVAALGGFVCYRAILRDMIPLALIVSNACTLLLIAIWEGLFQDIRGDSSAQFLLFALIILVVVSAAAFLLRRTAANMARDAGEGGNE